MAVSTVVKNHRDGTQTIEDGAALSLAVPFDLGDIALSGLMEGQKEVAKYLSRGDLASVRYTNQTFPTISWSCLMTDVSDAASYVTDACLRRGAWAAATSTYSSATGAVYTVKLTWAIEGTELGDGADHSIVLDDVRITSVDATEGDPNSYKFSGEVLGSITLT